MKEIFYFLHLSEGVYYSINHNNTSCIKEKSEPMFQEGHLKKKGYKNILVISRGLGVSSWSLILLWWNTRAKPPRIIRMQKFLRTFLKISFLHYIFFIELQINKLSDKTVRWKINLQKSPHLVWILDDFPGLYLLVLCTYS